MSEKGLEEKIAREIHSQWIEWSTSVIKEIMGGPETDKSEMRDNIHEIHERWMEYWKMYSELPGDIKEKDREQARRIIEIIEEECESMKRVSLFTSNAKLLYAGGPKGEKDG